MSGLFYYPFTQLYTRRSQPLTRLTSLWNSFTHSFYSQELIFASIPPCFTVLSSILNFSQSHYYCYTSILTPFPITRSCIPCTDTPPHILPQRFDIHSTSSGSGSSYNCIPSLLTSFLLIVQRSTEPSHPRFFSSATCSSDSSGRYDIQYTRSLYYTKYPVKSIRNTFSSTLFSCNDISVFLALVSRLKIAKSPQFTSVETYLHLLAILRKNRYFHNCPRWDLQKGHDREEDTNVWFQECYRY
jgi:hypothetical protein